MKGRIIRNARDLICERREPGERTRHVHITRDKFTVLATRERLLWPKLSLAELCRACGRRPSAMMPSDS
jgi:hypothetical protein